MASYRRKWVFSCCWIVIGFYCIVAGTQFTTLRQHILALVALSRLLWPYFSCHCLILTVLVLLRLLLPHFWLPSVYRLLLSLSWWSFLANVYDFNTSIRSWNSIFITDLFGIYYMLIYCGIQYVYFMGFCCFTVAYDIAPCLEPFRERIQKPFAKSLFICDYSVINTQYHIYSL